MLTLWDLAWPKKHRRRRPRSAPPASPKIVSGSRPLGPKALLYEQMTRELLAEHSIRVRKWRSSMSGVAWQVTYKGGSVSRLIEAPHPRGPMSAAVFLHEVGHHAIGFGRFRPRCLEEFHAWRWSLDEMERRGITITPNVRKRMHESLHYAVLKARRRGLKRLPGELELFARPFHDPTARSTA